MRAASAVPTLGLSATLGGWTAARGAESRVIRFGQSASMTGGQAAYGQDMRNGIAAAFAAASAQEGRTGLRFELKSGDVVHYRPSGNAPELRCYTEAATAERADELLAWGMKAAEAVVR